MPLGQRNTVVANAFLLGCSVSLSLRFWDECLKVGNEKTATSNRSYLPEHL